MLPSTRWLDAAAQAADAVVVVVGEEPYSEGSGNLRDLTLDRDQLLLVQRAQATGKPVILVVVAGRPRLITEVYEGCAAVVWAGLPGFEGAPALAELIAGVFCPSGRLPFSYPAWSGHFYPYYHKLLDRDHYRGMEEETHLAPFGHGLSYTSFSYGELDWDAKTRTARIVITNTGPREGKETVLWYLFDEIASITRPLKLLKHFERVSLAPGEHWEARFVIDPEAHLSFSGPAGELRLEAGDFTLSVADKSLRFYYP